MHIKCTQHERRIVVINELFIHRNGDGLQCFSPTALIGEDEFGSGGIEQQILQRKRRGGTSQDGQVSS